MNVTVYYVDEEKELSYISQSDIKQGDLIVMPGSTQRYELTKTAKLKGVYNINKGYADFKQISILYDNDEYSVVKSNTNYGLNVYDYIVLNAEMVKDNQFIYE